MTPENAGTAEQIEVSPVTQGRDDGRAARAAS